MSSLPLLLLLLVLVGGGEAAPTPQKFKVRGRGRADPGETVTLRCGFLLSSATSPSSYEWTRDGKVIPGEISSTLTLSPVTTQHVGIYQCGDPNSDLERLEHDLYVTSSKLPQPSIKPEGEEVLGRNFILQCLIMKGYTATNKTVYTWYKDGTEIEGQSSQVLQFSRVRDADRGKYTCTAREGPEETTSPHAEPHQLLPYVSPEIRMKPTSPDNVIKGILGENLTLSCEVTRAFPEVPEDGYSWSYLPSSPGPWQPLVGKTNALSLGPLTTENGGQYFCQARNDQSLPGLSLTRNASITVCIIYLDNITLTPYVKVKEGDPVTLACKVDSHPAARLTWTIHGQEVRHVTDNLDHYVIQHAGCSDSTSYTCRASNPDMPGREMSASTPVQVQCDTGIAQDKSSPDLLRNWSGPFAAAIGSILVCFGIIIGIVVGGILGVNCRDHILKFRRNVRTSFTTCCNRRNVTTLRLEEDLTFETLYQNGQVYVFPALSPPPDEVQTNENEENESGAATPLLKQSSIDPGAEFTIKDLVRSTLQESTETSDPPSFLLHNTRLSRQENIVLVLSRKLGVLVMLVKAVKDVEELQPEHKAVRQLLEARKKVEERLADLVKPGAVTAVLALPNLHRSMVQSIWQRLKVLRSNLDVMVLLGQEKDDFQRMTKHLMSRPDFRSPVPDSSEAESLGTDSPGAASAGADSPGAESPGADSPGAESPGADSPWADSAGAESPEAESPGTDSPGADRPGAHSPGADSPDAHSPGADSADTVYMMATSRFLTLTGCSPPRESPRQPAAAEEGWLLTPAQLQVRDSTARLLHIWGPPGSGKTSLMIQKAREWLEEGKGVVLAVGREFYDVQLAHIREAVERGQDEETRSRIRSCRTYQEIDRAVIELRGPPPHKETCVMIDGLRETARFYDTLPRVKSKMYHNIWSTGREDIQSLDPELWKKARKLDWESACLPACIRCTKSTVKLLNLLVRGSPDYATIPACSLPCAQDILPWRVVDHSLHPQHTSTTSGCPQCKEKMSAALPSPEGSQDWRGWIALCTGNRHVYFDGNTLCEVLKDVGVPAVYYSGFYLRSDAGTQSSSAAMDLARYRKLVDTGVDQEGRPAVHLLQCTDFRGMERQGVLLVHWDQRDEGPACQSRKERKARLTEHRRQWISAISRSRGQVILLLLSPSPARTLLDPQESDQPSKPCRCCPFSLACTTLSSSPPLNDGSSDHATGDIAHTTKKRGIRQSAV